MDDPLKSFLKANRRRLLLGNLTLAAMALVLSSALAAIALDACHAPPPPKAAAAEASLCKARSEWLLAVAVDPSLAPAPGSLRARLEAAEDAFCKAQPDGGTL